MSIEYITTTSGFTFATSWKVHVQFRPIEPEPSMGKFAIRMGGFEWVPIDGGNLEMKVTRIAKEDTP